MIETADPVIDDFIAEMRQEIERLRKQSPSVYEEPEGFNLITGSPVVRVFSDGASRARRLVAYRDAIKAAEELKLEVNANVSERLDEIRSGLPKVELERVGGK